MPPVPIVKAFPFRDESILFKPDATVKLRGMGGHLSCRGGCGAIEI